MKVCEIFEVDKRVGRLFGLEVECEGDHLPYGTQGAIAIYWNQVDDGSLRGIFPDTRCEYVSERPLTLEEAEESLKVLYSEAKRAKTVWKFSHRTSFHVHMNVSDLEENQVLNIVYAYRLLESALFSKCQDVRKNNRFCLRAMDSDFFIEMCDRLFREGIQDVVRRCAAEELRYSSLNLASIPKHGTLEIRCKDATGDVNEMIDWVKTLDKLVTWAIGFKDPWEMFEFVRSTDIPLARTVLGIEEDSKEFERDISLSLQIPFLFQELVHHRAKLAEVVKEKPAPRPRRPVQEPHGIAELLREVHRAQAEIGNNYVMYVDDVVPANINDEVRRPLH